MDKIKILEKVKNHAEQVKKFIQPYNAQHIMTVLVGSQNYGLDSENSDIDTYSFIAPSLFDLMTGKEPLSKEYEVEDGKCVVKDIRLAFNLLRKPSPNSVECFVSKYKYYEPAYESTLKYFLETEVVLRVLVHANVKNMLNAIAGTAHGLHGRNMTEGKKYAHCLRLEEMAARYVNWNVSPFLYLDLHTKNLAKARAAKFEELNLTDEYMQQQCKAITEILTFKANNFIPSEGQKTYEHFSLVLIDSFQEVLFNKYLELNGYKKE